MVKVSVCPVCGGEAGQAEMPGFNADQLAEVLAVEAGEDPDCEYRGFLCLCCQQPYLVVYLTKVEPAEAQALAGFLPKGGR